MKKKWEIIAYFYNNIGKNVQLENRFFVFTDNE